VQDRPAVERFGDVRVPQALLQCIMPNPQTCFRHPIGYRNDATT
jgi:hypothetical protein